MFLNLVLKTEVVASNRSRHKVAHGNASEMAKIIPPPFANWTRITDARPSPRLSKDSYASNEQTAF